MKEITLYEDWLLLCNLLPESVCQGVQENGFTVFGLFLDVLGFLIISKGALQLINSKIWMEKLNDSLHSSRTDYKELKEKLENATPPIIPKHISSELEELFGLRIFELHFTRQSDERPDTSEDVIALLQAAGHDEREKLAKPLAIEILSRHELKSDMHVMLGTELITSMATILNILYMKRKFDTKIIDSEQVSLKSGICLIVVGFLLQIFDALN